MQVTFRTLVPDRRGVCLRIKKLHDWPNTPQEAESIQKDLSRLVITEVNDFQYNLVTAIDTSWDDRSGRAYAVAVTIDISDFNEVERSRAEGDVTFPYRPSMLSFREGPLILKALERLKVTPDVLLLAGHGLAHPLGFGLASHIGLLADTASVGCARRILFGRFDEPKDVFGQSSPIYCGRKICGYVLRSRVGVKPVFVSPGHKCNVDFSLKLAQNCLNGYRMPGPLRLARMAANRLKDTAQNNEDAVKN